MVVILSQRWTYGIVPGRRDLCMFDRWWIYGMLQFRLVVVVVVQMLFVSTGRNFKLLRMN